MIYNRVCNEYGCWYGTFNGYISNWRKTFFNRKAIWQNLTKKHKEALAKVDSNKLYSLKEASALLKEITYTKFDASVDIAVRFRCRSS